MNETVVNVEFLVESEVKIWHWLKYDCAFKYEHYLNKLT